MEFLSSALVGLTEVWEFAFLTSAQVRSLLLVWGPYLEWQESQHHLFTKMKGKLMSRPHPRESSLIDLDWGLGWGCGSLLQVILLKNIKWVGLSGNILTCPCFILVRVSCCFSTEALEAGTWGVEAFLMLGRLPTLCSPGNAWDRSSRERGYSLNYWMTRVDKQIWALWHSHVSVWNH